MPIDNQEEQGDPQAGEPPIVDLSQVRQQRRRKKQEEATAAA